MALVRRQTPSRFPLVCHPMCLILALLSLLSKGQPGSKRKNFRVAVAHARNRRKNRDLLRWCGRNFLAAANRVKWINCPVRTAREASPPWRDAVSADGNREKVVSGASVWDTASPAREDPHSSFPSSSLGTLVFRPLRAHHECSRILR